VFINELTGYFNISKRCHYSSGKITYLGEQGNATIRNIPVRKWTQCVYDHKTKILSLGNYYFNRDGMETPTGNSDIPIRYESKDLTGSKSDEKGGIHFIFYSNARFDSTIFFSNVFS
jgi:hypothetical protein